MKKILTTLLLFSSLCANAAQWTPSTGSLVGVINPGAISGKNTLISLVGVSFSGCPRTDGALLLGENPNYQEIYSLILAAKMAGKTIRIYYGDCSGNFPIINQAYIL
jgi:hypothetical protein